MRTSSEGKASPLGCGWLVISCGTGLDGKLSTISPTSFADSAVPEEAPKDKRLDLCLTNGCSSTSSASSWTEEFPSSTVNWLDGCIVGKPNPCLHEETNHLLGTCTMPICKTPHPIPNVQIVNQLFFFFKKICSSVGMGHASENIYGLEPKNTLSGYIPTF